MGSLLGEISDIKGQWKTRKYFSENPEMACLLLGRLRLLRRSFLFDLLLLRLLFFFRCAALRADASTLPCSSCRLLLFLRCLCLSITRLASSFFAAVGFGFLFGVLLLVRVLFHLLLLFSLSLMLRWTLGWFILRSRYIFVSAALFLILFGEFRCLY